MNKNQKRTTIQALQPMFEDTYLYITDCKGLSANQMYQFRYMLYKEKVVCKIIPNALLSILLRKKDHTPLMSVLKQNSMVLFVKSDPSKPAKIIKKFRETEKINKPLLKGAIAYDEYFIGEESLDKLVQLKSKEEMLRDILQLLRSPLQQLIHALQSGKHKIFGITQAIMNK